MHCHITLAPNVIAIYLSHNISRLNACMHGHGVKLSSNSIGWVDREQCLNIELCLDSISERSMEEAKFGSLYIKSTSLVLV